MPHSPKLANKANELIERLSVVAHNPKLDNFEVQRIARDANALMQSNPAGAHAVLGGIAALRGNADDSRNHHRIALTLGQRRHGAAQLFDLPFRPRRARRST